MDTRKLIGFGKSSYVVSLPNEWVKEQKLKKGDTLYVSQEEGGLSITPLDRGKQKERKEILIPTKNKSIELLRTEIVSAYLNNYSLITIKGDELKKEASEIKKIIHNLSGLEVIEGTAEKIVVKDLLDEEEVNINKLIRRMDNIVRSMMEDSIECLRTDLFESVYERDYDVNRIVFLTYRVLRGALENPVVAKKFGMMPLELLFNWIVVTQLEKIGDQSKRIARLLVKIRIKETDSKKLESIYSYMRNKFEEVMKAYYTLDMELAYGIEVDDTKRIEMCNEFMDRDFPKISGKESCIEVSRIIEYLKGMSTSIKNLSRAVIGAYKPTENLG